VSTPDLHPDIVRAEIRAAETRAGLEAKRKRRKWILIGGFIAAVIATGLGVAVFLLFQSVGQVKAQGKTIAHQTDTIAGQTKTIQEQGAAIVKLQEAQTANSAQGRALIQKVVDLTSLIASFTDPNSPAARARNTTAVNAIKSVLAGQQVQNADQLRKLGEIAVVLAPPGDEARVRAAVAKILAEPAPPIVVAPVPARASGASVVPPPDCQGIQAAPLNIVKVCIPP